MWATIEALSGPLNQGGTTMVAKAISLAKDPAARQAIGRGCTAVGLALKHIGAWLEKS